MARHPFDELPLVLQRRKDELFRLVNGIVQKAATGGGAYLVDSTPVKRGVARSNWVASVDQRFSSVIPAYHPYPALDKGPAPIGLFHETANGDAAKAQHEVSSGHFDWRRNHAVYIQNNAAHISLLNQGRSRQNPSPGWFEKSVDACKRAIAGKWKLKA